MHDEFAEQIRPYSCIFYTSVISAISRMNQVKLFYLSLAALTYC